MKKSIKKPFSKIKEKLSRASSHFISRPETPIPDLSGTAQSTTDTQSSIHPADPVPVIAMGGSAHTKFGASQASSPMSAREASTELASATTGALVQTTEILRTADPQRNDGNISTRFDGKSSAVQDGWKGFKLALGVLKESSAVFGPLQSAVGGLLKVIEVVDQVSANEESFISMKERIERLAHAIREYGPPPLPEHIKDRIDAFSQSIERHKIYIEHRINRSLVQRVLQASDDENDVMNSLREITFAIDLFQMGTSISIELQGQKTTQIVSELYELELFKRLEAVGEARYDSGSRTGCIDGTRVDTLTQLLAWADNPAGHRIFWLNGMAGIGKSAIAHSICQIIDDGRLGASFFCSRQSASLNKIGRVFPTIAYQLAHRSETYCQALVRALKQSSGKSYTLAALQDQAQRLFIDLKGSIAEAHPLVIVIDALDECTGLSDVRDFLRVLLRSDLPLKFLVTSRPETHIAKGFSSRERLDIDNKLTKSLGFGSELLDYNLLRLHDVEADIVKEDINRYLRNKLSTIWRQTGENKAERNLQALVEKSGNLFIFAFTAVQYLLPGDVDNLSPEDIEERLSMILQPSKNSSSRLSTGLIDELYGKIFESAYKLKEKAEINRLRAPLDTLLCLHSPQSISVIATLLGRRQDGVRAHLGNFTSVVSMPPPHRNDEPIFAFHASFPDYVLDFSRSKEYALDSHAYYECHQRLALACLKLMNSSLSENLCGIESRQTLNTDVSESLIHERIFPALRYACVYWASHLATGAAADPTDPSLVWELQIFVRHHLLHWLECLSLIQKLHAAYECVYKARRYLKQHTLASDFGEIQGMLLDAEYMIPQVYYFIKLHALEVYFSALVWLPSQSNLKSSVAFTPHGYSHIPSVVCGLDHYWDACLQVLQTGSDRSGILCLAFSPSGIDLACSAGCDIQVWNLETGEAIKQLKGHTGRIRSVVFSQDGSKLASGSDDRTVRIWNPDTGELIKQLEGHMNRVQSVAFSQDGSEIASGSHDKTRIRPRHIWYKTRPTL